MPHFTIAQLRKDHLDLAIALARMGGWPDEDVRRIRACEPRGASHLMSLFAHGALFGLFSWRAAAHVLHVDHFLVLDIGTAAARRAMTEAIDALGHAHHCAMIEIRLKGCGTKSVRKAGWRRLGRSRDATIFRKKLQGPKPV